MTAKSIARVPLCPADEESRPDSVDYHYPLRRRRLAAWRIS